MQSYCTAFGIGTRVAFLRDGKAETGTIVGIRISRYDVRYEIDVRYSIRLAGCSSTVTGMVAPDLTAISAGVRGQTHTCTFGLGDLVDANIGDIDRVARGRVIAINIGANFLQTYTVETAKSSWCAGYRADELSPVDSVIEQTVAKVLASAYKTQYATSTRDQEQQQIVKIWQDRIECPRSGDGDAVRYTGTGEAPTAALRRNEYVALPMRDTRTGNDGGFDWQVVFIDRLGKVLAKPYYDIPGRIAAEHLAVELNKQRRA
jgi:hypothetical protein